VKIDYFLYGKITGLRTLKGVDIDYEEEAKKYNTYHYCPIKH
jgi:hypothetical protein